MPSRPSILLVILYSPENKPSLKISPLPSLTSIGVYLGCLHGNSLWSQCSCISQWKIHSITDENAQMEPPGSLASLLCVQEQLIVAS